MTAVATLVERRSRYLMLVALPDGHRAELVADALAQRITRLPDELRRSLTWDQGEEMAAHARFSSETGLPVSFCDPRSPWQRGSNENTNGLLRLSFPKRTSLAPYSQANLDAIAAELNGRPRLTLGWLKPSEALDQALRSPPETKVVCARVPPTLRALIAEFGSGLPTIRRMATEGGHPIGEAIRQAGLSIYDDLATRPDLIYDIADLELILNEALVGAHWDFPIRTRSKVAKEAVAEALGYPVPSSFQKTQPRFPGQNLDTFVQMADNLQIWNEEVDPQRRYALIRVTSEGTVTAVRVVTGEVIALWDHTGTLTSKYQAKRRATSTGSKLVAAGDTPEFANALQPGRVGPELLTSTSPTSRPVPGLVLSITTLHERMQELVGTEFDDPGVTQDRSRGIIVQQLTCEVLGLAEYGDVGQFPDILCQALEVKLQLSPTIDLGLVLPDSDSEAQELGRGLRHRDARYSIVYGSRVAPNRIRVDAVVTSTGKDFFDEFQRFEGNVQNKKLQIPLPRHLIEAE